MKNREESANRVGSKPPADLAPARETIWDMTPRPDPHAEAIWLRKLDRATTAHERARASLEELIADARAAGVPLMTIAKHTPYSREWARKIADRVDAERESGEAEPGSASE